MRVGRWLVMGLLSGLLCTVFGCSARAQEFPETYYLPEKSELLFSKARSEGSGYAKDLLLVAFDSKVCEESLLKVCHAVQGEVVGKLSGVPIYQVRVSLDLEEACETVMELGLPQVLGVMKDHLFSMDTIGAEEPSGVSAALSSEDTISTAWQKLIYLSEAQGSMDSVGMPIGIVDSGFDYEHPDMDIEGPEASVDYDAGLPTSEKHHGTMVAAVAGGLHTEKFQGAAPAGTKVWCVDWGFYGYDHSGSTEYLFSSMMDAVFDCLQQGCKVVNLSQGVSDLDDLELSRECAGAMLALARKYYAGDFLLVQAAGNDGSPLLGGTGFFTNLTPLDIKRGVEDCLHSEEVSSEWTGLGWEYDLWRQVRNQVLVVGCSEGTSALSQAVYEGSNYGVGVDVYVPGVNLYGPKCQGYRYGWTGTSFSAPQVAGVASMLWGKCPSFIGADVRDCILGSALNEVAPSSSDTSGKDCWLLDAGQAMRYAKTFAADGYWKRPFSLFEARGGAVSAQQSRYLRIGMFYSDPHFYLARDWDYRLSHQRDTYVATAEGMQYGSIHGEAYGGFYLLQTDRYGRQWLKCKELDNQVISGQGILSGVCCIDAHRQDSSSGTSLSIYEKPDYAGEVALYRAFSPEVLSSELPKDMQAEVAEYRQSSDWILCSQPVFDGKRVIYYGD